MFRFCGDNSNLDNNKRSSPLLGKMIDVFFWAYIDWAIWGFGHFISWIKHGWFLYAWTTDNCGNKTPPSGIPVQIWYTKLRQMSCRSFFSSLTKNYSMPAGNGFGVRLDWGSSNLKAIQLEETTLAFSLTIEEVYWIHTKKNQCYTTTTSRKHQELSKTRDIVLIN